MTGSIWDNLRKTPIIQILLSVLLAAGLYLYQLLPMLECDGFGCLFVYVAVFGSAKLFAISLLIGLVCAYHISYHTDWWLKGLVLVSGLLAGLMFTLAINPRFLYHPYMASWTATIFNNVLGFVGIFGLTIALGYFYNAKSFMTNFFVLFLVPGLIMSGVYSHAVNQFPEGEPAPGGGLFLLIIGDDSAKSDHYAEQEDLKNQYIQDDNLEGCKILDESNKGFCVRAIATARKDITACNELQYNDVKSYCIQDVAKATINREYCHLIELSPPEIAIQRCVQEILPLEIDQSVASGNPNPELCRELEIHRNRWHCMRKMAVSLNDASLCEQIENTQSRDICLREVEVGRYESTHYIDSDGFLLVS